MSLWRFAYRTAPQKFLDDSPDAQTAAADIVNSAATGQQNLSAATIHVLEQTAFKLSLTVPNKMKTWPT